MLQYLSTLISVATCMSLASYEIFDSFDEISPSSPEMSRINLEPKSTTSTSTTVITTETAPTTDPTTELSELLNASVVTTEKLSNISIPTTGLLKIRITTEKLPNISAATTEGLFNTSTATTENILRITVGYRRKISPKTTIKPEIILPPLNLTIQPYACPEEEKPFNIGPYEVPTQRDLLLHIRKILLHMFRSYHKKALGVLKDMKEATKASWPREESCQSSSKLAYRRCVRTVSNRCEVAAKSLVLALEALRADVLGLLQGKVCDIGAMNADPIQLIRILAMEKVSLEFALPGFLRLLNACAGLCSSSRSESPADSRKPVRLMMTDQDLVVRHFLTQKSYDQLLKGTT